MTAAASLPVIAVTGLAAEARIAQGAEIVTVAGGGDAVRLAQSLEAALIGGARGVISFGIAGGLATDLLPGSVIIAEGVQAGDVRYPADDVWLARLSECLPQARRGDVAGVDRAVADRADKAALHRRGGALAVDMESHVAARLALLHRVGFAALRVVADPAHRTLPLAATVGLRPDGRLDVPAVLGALLRHPGDLPGLIRTAMDAGAAFAVLKAARRRLPGALAFDGARRPRQDAAPDGRSAQTARRSVAGNR